MTEQLKLNDHPLNQVAKKHLFALKEPHHDRQLYVVQLMWVALEDYKAPPQMPGLQDRMELEVGRLSNLDPAAAMKRLAETSEDRESLANELKALPASEAPAALLSHLFLRMGSLYENHPPTRNASI